jgi:hypothetical protein
LGSKASGGTSIARWTTWARPLMFCSPSRGMSRRPRASSPRPCVALGSLKPSPLMAARPMLRPFERRTRRTARRSLAAPGNVSILGSNRTSERSNESSVLRGGGQSCAAAQETLAGVELMPMRKQGPLVVEEGKEGRTPAEQGYALAASSAHRQGQLSSHGLHTKICDRVSPLSRSSRPLDQRRRSSLQGPTHEISRQHRILSLTL